VVPLVVSSVFIHLEFKVVRQSIESAEVQLSVNGFKPVLSFSSFGRNIFGDVL
jgi:hypothetical protein